MQDVRCACGCTVGYHVIVPCASAAQWAMVWDEIWDQVMFEGSKSEALAVQMADHQRQISVGRFLKFGVSLKIFFGYLGVFFCCFFRDDRDGLDGLLCTTPIRPTPHSRNSHGISKTDSCAWTFCFPCVQFDHETLPWMVICGAWLGMAMIQMKTQQGADTSGVPHRCVSGWGDVPLLDQPSVPQACCSQELLRCFAKCPAFSTPQTLSLRLYTASWRYFHSRTAALGQAKNLHQANIFKICPNVVTSRRVGNIGFLSRTSCPSTWAMVGAVGARPSNSVTDLLLSIEHLGRDAKVARGCFQRDVSCNESMTVMSSPWTCFLHLPSTVFLMIHWMIQLMIQLMIKGHPRLFALLFTWLREWPNAKGRHVSRSGMCATIWLALRCRVSLKIGPKSNGSWMFLNFPIKIPCRMLQNGHIVGLNNR